MKPTPLVEKVNLLERRLAIGWRHSLLEPFFFDSGDVIAVQQAAKQIAKHIGLPDLTFVIYYSQQEKNVGGNINDGELNNLVYIEIDNDFKSHHDVVLAILAHEICHKYLSYNNIKLFPDFENEILTDVATVYTGLGKLSLNGCEKAIENFDSLGQTSKISSIKIGYLSRQQFAFVYRLINEMRRVPEIGFLHGLTLEAKNEVVAISNSFSEYFTFEPFSNEFTLSEINAVTENEVECCLTVLAQMKKNLVFIEKIRESAESKVISQHHFIRDSLNELKSKALQTKSLQSSTYIKNLALIEEIKCFRDTLIEKNSLITELLDQSDSFILNIKNEASQLIKFDVSDFLLTFQCPICHKAMKISQKKLGKVRCPKCNYTFIIDTSDEKLIEPKVNFIPPIKKMPDSIEFKKRSIANRIVDYFKK
jgi:ssDNA-binding Zn-finger/Zn-ribbon topoisomerase 1